MSKVTLVKFDTASPDDTSPLERLKRLGYAPDDIIAVVGKSEGSFVKIKCGRNGD